MKIAVVSDLHFEFHADWGDGFIKDTIDPLLAEVDILILAGDICPHKMMRNMFPKLIGLASHTVFVAGNHEYYGATPEQIANTLRYLEEQLPNFHWLNHSTFKHEGVVFAGTTLWFPQADPITDLAKFAMADFSMIKGFVPWVYEEHAKAVQFLQGLEKVDVVITHHLPTPRCVARRFWGNPLNHYFSCDISEVVYALKPKLWVFGHTHVNTEFMDEGIKFVCNPLGYPYESLPFNTRKIVELNML